MTRRLLVDRCYNTGLSDPDRSDDCCRSILSEYQPDRFDGTQSNIRLRALGSRTQTHRDYEDNSESRFHEPGRWL